MKIHYDNIMFKLTYLLAMILYSHGLILQDINKIFIEVKSYPSAHLCTTLFGKSPNLGVVGHHIYFIALQ